MAELILGPPGCGKTHSLIDIVKKALDRNVAPEDIGFLSFTKKAVSEAATRAGREFNLNAKQLPYFKTLHALGFQQLGLKREDVMDVEDWRSVGRELGLDMRGVSQHSADGGVIMTGADGGDKYLNMIQRAQMRQVGLDQEFRESLNRDLYYPMAEKMGKLLDVYRKDMYKVTFVDMLTMFLEANNPPRLKLLIIDEAQDLVPLQWAVVNMMSAKADEVYFAGDDDQAIHRWAGVDVEQMMAMKVDKVTTLNQSYRLPQTVFDLSQVLVKRIRTRMEKHYAPTDKVGSVNFHPDRDQIDLTRGSWTLMARTNHMVLEWADELREEGYLFQIGEQRSIRKGITESVRTWERLKTGGTINLQEAKKLYDNLIPAMYSSKKLLDAAHPEELLDRNTLVEHYGLNTAQSRFSSDRAIAMSQRESSYISALKRRGEDIGAEPRIKISTIHAMKGGEDDNVAVDLGSTRAASETEYPDDEHRVFYVAATRAKENLHFIQSKRRYTYDV